MKRTIVTLFILSKFEFDEMSQSIVKCSFVFANCERVLVASPLRNLYFVQFVPIFTDKIMKNFYFEVSLQDSHYRYSSTVVNDHD